MEKKKLAMKIANYSIVAIAAAAYVACLVYLFLYADRNDFIISLVFPAGGFVAVTVIRWMMKKQRPYETQIGIPVNLLDKKATGNSFPSRHAYSIFAVSTVVVAISIPAGIALYVLGVVLAVLRVKAGVHSILDVTIGGVIGTICGSGNFMMIYLRDYSSELPW